MYLRKQGGHLYCSRHVGTLHAVLLLVMIILPGKSLAQGSCHGERSGRVRHVTSVSRRSVAIAAPVRIVGRRIFSRTVAYRGSIKASNASNASNCKGKSVGAWPMSISVGMVLYNDYVHGPARLDA